MGKYKRITGKDNWSGCVTFSNATSKDEIFERLYELENKIENGTLYDFKFKIGHEVYIVCDWDIDKVVKGTISEIELTTNKNGAYHRIYVDHKYIYSEKNPNLVQHRYIFSENEIFLSKAEAEKKLEELKG